MTRTPATGPSRAPASPNRFDLYELAAQSPRLQALFLRALHEGPARVLVEDFCGPASIARAWAAMGPRFCAVGVDRDREPLAHAARRARENLGDGASRLTFERADVRRARSRGDAIAAFNFAVCELHRRADLIAYLTRARSRLSARGVFAADLYGGRDAWKPGRLTRLLGTPWGRTRYTWEQREADEARGTVVNAMHFALPGGRGLMDAFVYRWRLWSIAELRDALLEAGFASTEVHAGYGDALDGRGLPIPRPVRPGEPLDANYVVYVVGRKAGARRRQKAQAISAK